MNINAVDGDVTACSHFDKWGLATCVIGIVTWTVTISTLNAFYLLFFSRKVNRSWVSQYLSIECDDIVERECASMNIALNDASVIDDARLCALQMSKLIQQRHIEYSDLEKDPGIVMKCSRHTRTFNGALYTRFVVQYNLFAGSIVSLGGNEQKQALYGLQHDGVLGCFAFTETSNGVLTGLKVSTTATYVPETKTFNICSNGTVNSKSWISQGLFAEYAVILARVIVGGEDKGAHLLFARIQMKTTSGVLQALDGVSVTPSVPLNCLPGLDYANIYFDGFTTSRDALLSKYSSISDEGAYSCYLPRGNRRMVDLLLTRLVTGRVCLSEYSAAFAKNLLRTSWEYANARMLPGLGKRDVSVCLSELPLVTSAFYRYGQCLDVVTAYLADTRQKLIKCLEDDTISNDIIEAACVSKFVGTSLSVDVISAFRKVIGSFSLTHASHLGAESFVCNGICFAEGDNAIMEMKVVGDLVKGKVSMTPLALLRRCLWDGRKRRVLYKYLSLIAYAFCLGSSALKDGQLIRDIAWARAHLLIMDSWRRGGNSLSSYSETLVKFPTPTQF
jgi:acyl-CoA oxidase